MLKDFKNKLLSTHPESGAAMLISVVFFLFISIAIILGLVSPSVREFKNTNVDLSSKQSYFLAESGTEDALYRTIRNMPLSSSETITLAGNSVTTDINTLFVNEKEIVSQGNVGSYERKSRLTIQTGDGAVFQYGTQAGQGGFVFHNNSHVTGSLYSNGNIVGTNGAYVTGAAIAASNTGTISNLSVGQGGIGDAYAHNVNGTTVTGNMYCQSGSGNNKPCDTSRTDPPLQNLPIPDASISKWENDATLGGTTNGNVTVSSATTIGPRKIVGDLAINSTLTMAGTIYVTGNITFGIGGVLKLASSYGATSGIIVSDGYITISNNTLFQDSGTAGSFILLLSNSTCDASNAASPCFGNNAIDVSNNSNISIVNAQKGTVYFSNNATVKESVGNKIELKNNVGISYGSGIINIGFTSGPSGSWLINDWKEVK